LSGNSQGKFVHLFTNFSIIGLAGRMAMVAWNWRGLDCEEKHLKFIMNKNL